MYGAPGLLLTWINFNASMDNNHIHYQYKVFDEITYPFPIQGLHCWRLRMDKQFHPAFSLDMWLLIHASI